MAARRWRRQRLARGRPQRRLWRVPCAADGGGFGDNAPAPFNPQTSSAHEQANGGRLRLRASSRRQPALSLFAPDTTKKLRCGQNV